VQSQWSFRSFGKWTSILFNACFVIDGSEWETCKIIFDVLTWQNNMNTRRCKFGMSNHFIAKCCMQIFWSVILTITVWRKSTIETRCHSNFGWCSKSTKLLKVSRPKLSSAGKALSPHKHACASTLI